MKTVKNTEVKSVGDIFKVVGGGTPSTAVSKYWNGSIPWVTSADIDDHFTITPRKAITKEAIENSATHLLPKGSIIVVTRVGLGKVGIAHTDLCFSQDSQGLFVDDTICDTKYAAYQLQRNVQIFKHISRGTTINGVTKKQLLNVPFILPALKEQKKIVEEIETQFTRLDAGVAALKRAQANLKRYRAAVLKAACEGKLVPTEVELANAEGRSYETGEQLLQRILAERRAKWEEENKKKGGKKKYVESKGPDVSNLPKLPEGWAWATVGQVSNTVQYGYTASANKNTSGVRFLRITDIQNGNVNWDVVPTCKIPGRIIKDYKLQTDDIVFARTGATVGKSFRLRGQFPESVFASYLIRVKPTSQLLSDWLDVCFQSPDYWSQIKVSSVGIGQPNVNGTKLCALRVPIPPAKEQQRIVNEVERMSSVMDELDNVLTASNKRSDNLRNAVLQHMLILNTK